MARQFTESKIVIASHNAGKIKEIAELLSPLGVTVISASEAGLPEPEETGKTFIENAELKAKAAATASRLPALADDSGLSVSALGGAPGIYSARWAGENKDFESAMKRVADALLMSGQYDKTAHFHCALSLCWPDGECETFEGVLPGELIWPSRGDKGFGYDPMFLPNGYAQSFGEMDPEEKHAMNHRSIAFRKLLNACFQK